MLLNMLYLMQMKIYRMPEESNISSFGYIYLDYITPDIISQLSYILGFIVFLSLL